MPNALRCIRTVLRTVPKASPDAASYGNSNSNISIKGSIAVQPKKGSIARVVHLIYNTLLNIVVQWICQFSSEVCNVLFLHIL